MNYKKILFFGSASLINTGIGFMLGSAYSKKKINKCGNLRIDSSEENEPVKMFLEITNTSCLESSEYVVFKVVKENYISHKI